MSYRTRRVEEEIKREIASIIKDTIKDPRVGFVSLTGVDVTPDFRHAKVYVSVYGNEEAIKKTMEGLDQAAGYIRKEISQRIKLRNSPELSFHFDDSIRHGAKIAEILSKMQSGEGQNDA
ncbi:MAG: 30S ribosome-binding factor RbfA [Bacillota bacterium]